MTTCETCEYFYENSTGPSGTEGKDPTAITLCLRFPPQVVVVPIKGSDLLSVESVYPKVTKDTPACGEHTAF